MSAAILNFYAQTAMPGIFSFWAQAGLLDAMDIISDEPSQSDDGALKMPTALPVDYAAVPVNVRAAKSGDRLMSGERVLETGAYVLTFQVIGADGSTRINLDPAKHRLVVRARDAEPEKEYRIETVAEISGALWEAVCTKEN